MKALEAARAAKLIGKSLDAAVCIYTENEEIYNLFDGFRKELPAVFITSFADVRRGAAPADAFTDTASGIAVSVTPAPGCKCDRCWSYVLEGERTEDGGFICERCKKIVIG